jgi:hypothetical protein
MEKEKIVVVTRHIALVQYLYYMDYIDDIDDCIWLKHIESPEKIRGKDVIGVLPLHLAVEARSVTEIPLDIPEDMRGKELTFYDVRMYAREPRTYVVKNSQDYIICVDTTRGDYFAMRVGAIPNENPGCSFAWAEKKPTGYEETPPKIDCAKCNAVNDGRCEDCAKQEDIEQALD